MIQKEGALNRKKWLSAFVSSTVSFRIVWNKLKEKTLSEHERNRLETKLGHVQKRTEERARNGEIFLTSAEIKKLRLEIVDRISRGESTKTILRVMGEKMKI